MIFKQCGIEYKLSKNQWNDHEEIKTLWKRFCWKVLIRNLLAKALFNRTKEMKDIGNYNHYYKAKGCHVNPKDIEILSKYRFKIRNGDKYFGNYDDLKVFQDLLEVQYNRNLWIEDHGETLALRKDY